MKNSKLKREMIGYDTPEKISEEWEHIGEIGVDAGLCWLGDPCYILHKETPPEDIGKNWEDFCDRIIDENIKQFNYDIGRAGLGVCVSTGYGDGCYPVLAKFNDEGRIAEVKITFISTEI
tara:strand:- start:1793 stop:2152 length:360 start_codon:yes stop_codon:yes gene_type:complete